MKEYMEAQIAGATITDEQRAASSLYCPKCHLLGRRIPFAYAETCKCCTTHSVERYGYTPSCSCGVGLTNYALKKLDGEIDL